MRVIRMTNGKGRAVDEREVGGGRVADGGYRTTRSIFKQRRVIRRFGLSAEL